MMKEKLVRQGESTTGIHQVSRNVQRSVLHPGKVPLAALETRRGGDVRTAVSGVGEDRGLKWKNERKPTG